MRTVLRVFLVGALLLVVALGALVVRALRLPSRQLEVPPAPARAVDADGAAARLAEAIRIETVALRADEVTAPEAFAAFRAWLDERYPRLHASLEREVVNDHALLYTWRGSRPELAPLLLLAHQDVVPAPPDRWAHPPFAGTIADGFVWGRGAIDDKGSLVAICEAVELLLAEGFAPARTVILAFGHDEEVGGPQGAIAMAAALEARGVRAELVLDEGFALLETGALPGLPPLVAPIGIAEKGSVTLDVSARAAGGHSSTPPRHTAAGRLGEAVTAIEAHPLPVRVAGVTRTSLAWLAPELPLHLRVLLANADWLAPLAAPWVADVPALNAVLRTTTAVTMLEGSPKENVLPSEARATVNFRIIPGETGETVREHVRTTVEAPDIEVAFRGTHRDPSPVSPVDGPAFALLQRTIGEVFPQAVVAPALVLGGTDSRHYTGISDAIYRFAPFRFGTGDLARPHGIDERMSIESLAGAVAFYARLVENASVR